jgi:hypothetical protein
MNSLQVKTPRLERMLAVYAHTGTPVTSETPAATPSDGYMQGETLSTEFFCLNRILDFGGRAYGEEKDTCGG